MSKESLAVALLLMFLLVSTLAEARTNNAPPDPSVDFLLNDWSLIPHKEQRANLSYVQYVNNYLSPTHTWSEQDYTYGNNQKISLKCLSYAASTIIDWFKITTGRTLTSYQNFVNNNTEQGTNPRILETIYHSQPSHSFWSGYYYAPIVDDLVTRESVPYSTEGYAEIITNPQRHNTSYTDPEINSYTYTINEESFLKGHKHKDMVTNCYSLKKALENYGVIYIHSDAYYYTGLPIHAIALIGYDGSCPFTDFWYHDSYLGPDNQSYSRYGTLKFYEIRRAWKFYDPQWPTYHHDNRRTGYTLLKGDIHSLDSENDIEYYLGSAAQDAVTRASAADIDNDGEIEVVLTTSQNLVDGKIIAVEKKQSAWQRYRNKEGSTSTEWELTWADPIFVPPSLGNTDTDPELEIAYGTKAGDLVLIDNEQIDWSYPVASKYSAYSGNWWTGNVGFTAISDLDNDGEGEIIFTDFMVGLPDWPGELYIFEDNGGTYNIEDTVILGDGGAEGAVAVADIDNDGKLEIIVPAYYSLQVFDFDAGSLSQKCNVTQGKIRGSVTIYDIDRDNEYEAIYTTVDHGCQKGTCANQLHIMHDIENCGSITSIPILGKPFTGPSIANLDSDDNLEIALLVQNPTDTSKSKIVCYDSQTTNQDCEYPSSGWMETIIVSPNIADIDNKNGNDIIISSKTDEVVVYTPRIDDDEIISLHGKLGSSPIIADIDQDGVAELAVKRSGSPVAYLTVIGGDNKPPLLGPVKNITAIASELIDINDNMILQSHDFNPGDQLSYHFSGPFDDNGTWQSTVNDTGNYSILIEVSDGNMSDYKYIDVVVFNYTTQEIKKFSDDQLTKTLSFTGPQTKTMQITIPKRSKVVHTQMDIEGKN